MDVLDDILSSLRLTGGVVIDAKLRGDFCVRAEFTPDHCAPFFPMPDALIGYHYVRSGKMIVQLEGAPPVVLKQGDIAILPRNDAHLLASRIGLPAADASEVGWVTAEGVHRVAVGTEGPSTEVWCGFLGTARSSEHPLLEALPPLLTIDMSDGQSEWLDSSMRFVAEEHPSPDMVARLAELFLAQAIREYVEQLPKGEGGWLAGLRDPAVARALDIIHNHYAEELDVESLAREAGVSRSVLGERFTELIGEPPMRYCARWRMRVASIMLREAKDNTANIAYAVGFNSEAAFNRAFKREYGEPPAAWRKRQREEEERAQPPSMDVPIAEQKIRYCRAHDGTQLAYSVVGEGRPLVKTANWLNHLEFDFESPIWRPWLSELCRDASLVRYDERGNGLSDWDTPELSLDAFVDDLACVVDDAGLERFDLLGISQGAPVSIAYAIRHPERVRKIVLCGAYAAGWRARGETSEIERREAMVTLTELGWGADNPAYRQLFTSIYIPGASPRQAGWYNELQRRSTSPGNAAALMRVLSNFDVRDLLGKVTHPTLVFHARDDQAVPFSQGELLAREIPGARFIPLDSKNHILLGEERAFRVFIDGVRGFLGE